MLIGQRLRELREAQNLSQGDVEKRSGLFRSYISRVESGHTVPTIETLEKYAGALNVPLYRLFYDRKRGLQHSDFLATGRREALWGSRTKEKRELRRLRKALSGMSNRRRSLLLGLAQWLADHAGR
jgi:transcriptional regulator with XRE-family HTH domain